MHRKARLLLAAVIATAMLAAAVGSASAGRFSVSNQNFRVTWARLELTNTVTENSVRCPLTLEGSFHSATIRKVARALLGYISRASVANTSCTGGNATVNQESLPWHLTYEGFIGALPNITGLRLLLIKGSFIISTGGNTCRVTGTLENPSSAIANLTSGTITSLRADESRRFPMVNGPGGLFCGLAVGIWSGTGGVTLLGATTNITIRLI